ncbi:hypothetical protein [Citricoccus muralis]|uniref:Uncharacterized protein n=1 Tax=Citricoccus muralis TaxID=169134 RepID=A0ABY8H594_9MICC|nr:hypothetical protein [Citricoccus muralis]WFP16312.1 hypothetical protein P8192_13155 [Citricoccus muralis]
MTHPLHPLIPWIPRTALLILAMFLWFLGAPAWSLILLAVALIHLVGGAHRAQMAPRHTVDSLALAREAGR